MKESCLKYFRDKSIKIADIDLCIFFHKINNKKFKFWKLKCNSDDVNEFKVTLTQKIYIQDLYDEDSCCYNTEKLVEDYNNNVEIAIEVISNTEWWLGGRVDITEYTENELKNSIKDIFSEQRINLMICKNKAEFNFLSAKYIFMNDVAEGNIS